MSSNRVCKFFLQGFCSFGDRCWYSHDLSTVGAASLVVEERVTQRRPTQHKNQSNIPKYRQVKKTGATTTGNSLNNKENATQSSSGQANCNQTDEIQSDPVKTLQSAFESDLQCQICYEIFIKPIVINCKHTFCETCIRIWTRRVNRCPVCRMHIKSKAHCLTLNVFIEKMIKFMPEDVIIRRNLSIEERQKDAEEMNLNRGNTEGSDGLIGELDYFSENQDEDIDEDVIVQEADMFRMNLHDTVVSMGGLNPLIRYMLPPMGEHRL